MNAVEILHRISDSVTSTATVKSVYGEPIRLDGKTVVPIARIAYGFGAGSGGAGRPKHGGENSGDPGHQHAEGGGGGGGVRACPAGALEITPTQTRFIPFHDYRMVAAAFGAGLVWGGLVRRMLRKR